MFTDPQVLQIIFLATLRYCTAKRQEKQVADHDGRAISADEPRLMHDSPVLSERERSPNLRQAAARREQVASS